MSIPNPQKRALILPHCATSPHPYFYAQTRFLHPRNRFHHVHSGKPVSSSMSRTPRSGPFCHKRRAAYYNVKIANSLRFYACFSVNLTHYLLKIKHCFCSCPKHRCHDESRKHSHYAFYFSSKISNTKNSIGQSESIINAASQNAKSIL